MKNSGFELESIILKARESELKAGGRNAVVLTTGAMNPPHFGHTTSLQAAIKTLTENGYNCLGGILSVSHDLYVEPKCRRFGTKFATSYHRCKLAERVIAEWTQLLPCEESICSMSVGNWESSTEDYWPDFPEVMEELSRQLDHANLPNVKIFYACGSDHAEKCGLWNGFGGGSRFGVVISPRVSSLGEVDMLLQRRENKEDRMVYIVGVSSKSTKAIPPSGLLELAAVQSQISDILSNFTDTSSTHIRNHLSQIHLDPTNVCAEMEKVMGRAALDYCVGNHLYIPDEFDVTTLPTSISDSGRVGGGGVDAAVAAVESVFSCAVK